MFTFAKIATIGAWIAIWASSWTSKKTHAAMPEPMYAENPTRISPWGVMIFFIFLYAVLWIPFPIEAIFPVQWILVSIFFGYILLAIGTLLGAWATWTLGKLVTFSGAIPTNYSLIESGPYAYVRHPIQLAEILIWLGSSLIFVSVLGILMGAILLPLIKKQIRLEEKKLLEINGELYQVYTRRVGSLFLKLW
ncbi:isoprenylcysteine carboxylmethyltransferase family protein [Patescibacteria group bacterium]|nr:isoprenylcysteine carboxylmethyltransferase family protein [Patescibacteria group bacterium]